MDLNLEVTIELGLGEGWMGVHALPPNFITEDRGWCGRNLRGCGGNWWSVAGACVERH